jgi:hypothetical protein
MPKDLKPHTWSEQAAIAWIRTRDEKFARQASGYGNRKLHLLLAIWETAKKPLYYDNLIAARDALYVKVGDGSIRSFCRDKFGGDFSVEDVVRQFPPPEHAPASSAQVQDHVETVPDTPINSLADAANRSSEPEVNLRPRPMTEKSAVTFTEQYLKNMGAKGLLPTQKGLVEAAYAEGFRGGRQFLRDELSKRLGAAAPGPGRPREKRNSPK